MLGLRNTEKRSAGTKQGYLWILGRSLMVTEKLNPGWGISKGIVLSLSQSKVAEGQRE